MRNNEQLPTPTSMTLWQLLAAVAAAASVGGALAAAKVAQKGAMGWLVGGTVGLCLGVAAMVLAHWLGKMAYAHFDGENPRYGVSMMYTALIAWIFIVGYLSSILTNAILANTFVG